MNPNQNEQMLGKGTNNRLTLQMALSNIWVVEGAEHLEFAFAFTQSIYPSGIIFSFLPIY
jgi:hypothetical protein